MSRNRGDFTLYQRPPGKIWWARKRRKGKDFRVPLHTEDKGLGRERAEKWIKDLIASEWGEKPAKTFSDAMLRYAEERFSSLGDGGKRYATSIEHLSAHFGDVEMDKIKSSSLSVRIPAKPPTDSGINPPGDSGVIPPTDSEVISPGGAGPCWRWNLTVVLGGGQSSLSVTQ